MDELQGKSILVVDDDLELLDLVQLMFRRAGARVYTAADGAQGLRLFQAHPPDLVLLDLLLPGMDGWEVCQKIRQDSQVPLIMLTALSQRRQIVRGLACGADDYVTKPFGSEVLLARARALLRRDALPPGNFWPPDHGEG